MILWHFTRCGDHNDLPLHTAICLAGFARCNKLSKILSRALACQQLLTILKNRKKNL